MGRLNDSPEDIQDAIELLRVALKGPGGSARAAMSREALIGFGVLRDGGGFSVHREHHGAPGFLELFHEIDRKIGETSSVIGCHW